MPVDDEPLISIDAWPGVSARYAIAPGAAGSATLTVDVAFDPEDGQSAAGEQYAAILDQIDDARVAASVTTALADGPVAMGEQDVRAVLAGLVAQIVAFLDPETSGPAPAAVTLIGTLPGACVAEIAVDLLPLWVSLQIGRDAESDGRPPVASRLSPAVDSAAALAAWAGDLEAAFAGFDGGGGPLKVLSAATLDTHDGASVLARCGL